MPLLGIKDEAFRSAKRSIKSNIINATVSGRPAVLYEYAQIFVISNGTHTKYYSNTTRNAHIKELREGERRKSKKTSNSFEFTSHWADRNNKVISDLVDFTKTFFVKHLRTTPQAFGDKLHTYTIVNAINDENVLPFRIDFINTIKQKNDIKDKNVRAIDIEKALGAPERVREIVAYILERFDQKTKRNYFYSLKGQRLAGFNSIFAVSSIPMAMKYYTEFKTQLAQKNKKLTVATIFSYSANEDDPEDALPDEDFENDKLDKSSRDFLEAAITDYNSTFSTNYDTSNQFQNYYKDLSQRVKNR